jgi:glucokinase
VNVTLALDVGGTKVAGALIGPDQAILDRRQAPSVAPDGRRDPDLATTCGIARTLADLARSREWAVTAVGAGFPEYVAAGRLTSREVLAWTEQPGEVLAWAVPGVPIAVESDVRCGALAEATLGAGQGADSVFYVSWGTGLSSTFVLQGVPWTGAHGEALALGEWDRDARSGIEGPRQLEAYASGRGIAARYAALTGRDEIVLARQVCTAADDGDSAARTILDSAGQAVGHALRAIIDVLDPAVIVLGGGLGTSASRPVASSLAALAELPLRHRPLVRRAQLGPDSGLLGAALAARKTALPQGES